MATLTHTESRRLYSWWWDSHISPKNSKWLKENLVDMDAKVKSMIKLIEEDADSFAKRAEMYYKKRPELMKLVEEFYRAYRALAERYGHVTGALHHAHQKMEEAFPNEIPSESSDVSPGSYTTDEASYTPERSAPIYALFDCDDSYKDDLVTSQEQGIKMNEGFPEDVALASIREMLDKMFGCGEQMIRATCTEGNPRKSFDFQDECSEGSKFAIMQEEVSQLSKENQDLKNQLMAESVRADTAETEVRSLKDTIFNLNCEKEFSLLQYHISIKRIAKLETEISRSKTDFLKLNDVILVITGKLNSAEEQCLLLDKSNQFLQMELDKIKKREKKQEEELKKHEEELEQSSKAETAQLSLEKLHTESQEEVRLLILEIETGTEKLKDIELRRTHLDQELHKLKEENSSLNEQHLASALKTINLQDELMFLKDLKLKHENETNMYMEERKGLKQELSSLKEGRNCSEQDRLRLTKRLEEVNYRAESLEALVKELQNENEELKEICKKHESEKVIRLENLNSMEKMSEQQDMFEH